MRHSRSEQCLISAFLLASCSASIADGWATNAWPSQQYPRQGKTQVSQVWSATVERCQAAGVSLPSSPTWYRSTRTTVTDLKIKLKTAIPSYIDIRNSGTNNTFTNYFLSVATNARSLPSWSVDGILSYCKMPTNWFSYTPYRGLSGLGGNTNDVTVAFPYGETNASTASGGTNFPAGRNVWYSTDYGYSSITGMLGMLVSIGSVPAVSNFYAGVSYRGWATNWSSWASANAGMYVFFTTNQLGPFPDYVYDSPSIKIRFGSFWQTVPGSQYAREYSGQWKYMASRLYTNVSSVASYYVNIGPVFRQETGGGVSGEYTNTWETGGAAVGWSKYVMNLITNEDVAAGVSSVNSAWYGSTNSPVIFSGLAPDCATYPTTPWRSTKGWELWGDHYMVLRYDFVYK
jgi:hypothetical protein